MAATTGATLNDLTLGERTSVDLEMWLNLIGLVFGRYDISRTSFHVDYNG